MAARGAVGDREAHRDVMSFDAPAPGAFRGRRAEHREVVLLLVARHLAAGLDRPEDVFELDDSGDLVVATRAQAGAQQVVREPALRLVHLLDHQSLDRKSTRLNSSHSQISYAVFCLKKKKKKNIK